MGAHCRGLLCSFAVVFLGAVASTNAADWPAYRGDAARSGLSRETLPAPLSVRWTYKPLQAPAPAWPEPGRELNRMSFDYCNCLCAADGMVYFGSSADHTVRALDLATGQRRWLFFAGGPVRFAPTVSRGCLFFVSDDGYAYCLDARSGNLLWRRHIAPRMQKLFGNGSLISRWPLRTGVVVEGETAYVCAGMWPAEGVYLCALRAKDGSVIWQNDDSGSMYLPQPHPPSVGITGVVPQGPMVVTEGQIIIPTGRNVPAFFDKTTGDLQTYRSQPNSWGDRWGGTWNFATEDLLIGWRSHVGADLHVSIGESDPFEADGLIAYGSDGKPVFEVLNKHCAVARDGILYATGAGTVSAFDLEALKAGKKPEECVRWETPHGHAYALVLAGDTLFVGGRGTVTALAAGDGRRLWSDELPGQVRDLAVADGKLLCSTTDGSVVCYKPGEPTSSIASTEAARLDGYADRPLTHETVALARRILAETGTRDGYCLCLGAGDGRLAYELVKRSRLRVFCVEPDEAVAQRARESLLGAGVYGTRVVVLTEPLQGCEYPQFMANLIITANGEASGLGAGEVAEVHRLLHPCGGVAYLPGIAEGALADGGVPEAEIRRAEATVQVVRGKLPGAANWTHQYCSAARTGASEDTVARFPARLLWFGEPGPARMISRHWGGPAPLAVDGRMFALGQFCIIAVDAYNGHELWQKDLPIPIRYHAGSTGGSVVADDAFLYVLQGKTCLRVDQHTGKTVSEYGLPAAPASMSEKEAADAVWGDLAVDGDTIFGSIGGTTQARAVFALDKHTGTSLWVHGVEVLVASNGISVGPEHVYILDRTSADEVAKAKKRGEDIEIQAKIVALQRETGQVAWEDAEGLQERVALWLSDGVLVASGGGLTAYSAPEGKKLWERPAKMSRFPVTSRGVIYGEPHAYDLHTGEPILREHPLTGQMQPWSFSRSYGCGSIAGSPNMLLFRSGVVGFYDLERDSGVHNYGGVRAGCYVNTIATNGLILIPNGDAACTCSYNYQTTVALSPTESHENWGVFNAPAVKEGERIAAAHINLGAPGDQRAPEGELWLHYPRGGGLSVPIKVEPAEGGRDYLHNADLLPIEGTASPWIYTSGVSAKSINLAVGGSGPADYTVRLHFCETESARPGERVFDIKVGGATVAEGVDIVRDAGGPNRALVREFAGTAVKGDLTVELVTRPGCAPPLVSGIEVLAR